MNCHSMYWTLCYRRKLSCTEKQGFGYPWLQKKFQTHPPNLLKPSPVSERSAYSLQNYLCFSLLTSDLVSLATSLLPLTGPGLRPNVQTSS